MYTVYILDSRRHDRFYIGFTRNIRKRLKQHQTGQTPSVPASPDWQLTWTTVAPTAAEARATEKRIKARGAARFLKDCDG